MPVAVTVEECALLRDGLFHALEYGQLLAQVVGGDTARLIQGEAVFRCLGRINRLMFQNIGVRKVGRRNLRYAMYTGAQVEEFSPRGLVIPSGRRVLL